MSSKFGPTLGEVVRLVRGTTYKGSLLGQPGPVLLGLASIQRNGGFRDDALKTYGGESAAKLLLAPGDLFVSLKDVTQSADLLGAIARVPDSVSSGRLTQDTVKLEFEDNDYPRDLLYWALRTPQYRAYCRSRATGTTNLGLPREDFLAYRLPVPTDNVLSIVSTIGTLDDKIELNRKQSETLEAMARALFKAWFVDFEPVRAKLEGRWQRGQSLPGLPAHLYDLFPDQLVKSELGEIPEGWRVLAFGDVALQGKGTVSPALQPEETFTHYSLPAFDTGQVPAIELGESIKSNKTPVPDGAVLVSKLNPHIPRIWLVGDAGSRAICSTEFIVWTPIAPANNAFLYCLGSSSEFNSAMQQLVTGTSNSHQRVKPEQLREIRVIAAEGEVVEAFSRMAKSPMDQVLHNSQQSRSLAQIRDTLLPKLISGELRVSPVKQDTLP